MANVYFKDNLKVCTIDDSPEYLYIDDVEAFIQDCGDEWISDGVNKAGVYHWNDYAELWESDTSIVEEKIREIINSASGITKIEKNAFIGWNIIITLDSGEIIKTNSEPIDMNEIQEAMNIMLKPSFFGKRIKKFEIVAE